MKYAFMTSILWSVVYGLTGAITDKISITTYLSISCLFSLILFLSIGLNDNSLIKDLSSDKIPYSFLIISCVASFVATLCSVMAVKQTNAASAAMIEIAYPFFTIIFLYIFFGKNHFTPNFIIGGVLIFAGTLVVGFEKK